MLSYLKKSDGLTVAVLTASCYVAAYFLKQDTLDSPVFLLS